MIRKLAIPIARRLSEGRRVVEFLGAVGYEIAQECRNLRKFRVRETLYYLDLCGRQSLPIVLIICFLMGLILGFQGVTLMRQYGAELYVADGVGFSILKELGPLMVAMIATGRAGSAFAAEIGTMKAEEEISALQTMGISPERFLVIPKLTAMLIALPLLTVFGDAAGLAGGMVVGMTQPTLTLQAYWNRTFDVLHNTAFLLGVLKSVFFAVLITLAGCWRGFESSADAQGVGRSTTNAVVDSIFLVVVADAIITILYTTFGY